MQNLLNYLKAFSRLKHAPFLQGMASIFNLAGNHFALRYLIDGRFTTGARLVASKHKPKNLKRPAVTCVASAA